MARHTVACFTHSLIGREAALIPPLEASPQVNDTRCDFGATVLSVTITNEASAPFTLRNTSRCTLHEHADMISVPAHVAVTPRVTTGERLDDIRPVFEVLNVLTTPGVHPQLTLVD